VNSILFCSPCYLPQKLGTLLYYKRCSLCISLLATNCCLFQGCITHVHEGPGGEKLYDGVHTKGEAEDKWITYKGYSPKFQGLKLSELRISPNVLDVLSSENVQNSTGNNGVSTCDIFISFTKVCEILSFLVILYIFADIFYSKLAFTGMADFFHSDAIFRSLQLQTDLYKNSLMSNTSANINDIQDICISVTRRL